MLVTSQTYTLAVDGAQTPMLTESILPKIVSSGIGQMHVVKTYSYLKKSVKVFTEADLVAVTNKTIKTEFELLQIPSAFAIIDELRVVNTMTIPFKEAETQWISKPVGTSAVEDHLVWTMFYNYLYPNLALNR